MKILWHSNAPWAASGYGKQTKLFALRIAQMEAHELAISAFFGLKGARLEMGNVRVYPAGLDAHGNDVLELQARDFFGSQKAGVVIPLTDIWVLQPEVLQRLNTAAWVPVDHEPCQPPTVETMKKGRVLPIAMSRFGERMLVDAGFKPVYVPHGVETDVFTPLDRAECRKALGIPQDAFLVGMVAANQGHRKSFPQVIRAFKAFRQRHPEAHLYLHTWLGPQHQGYDLHQLLDQELPAEAVFVADQFRYAQGNYDDRHLAKCYGAMDVLMNPAQGEGFGVGIIEAQACGVPVILTNFSSMPELCGAGYLVGGTDVYTSFASWQLLPSVDELLAALETEYALPESDRLAARERAREFSLSYDADRVTAEYWVPALAEIEQRLLRKPRTARKKRRAR